MTIYIIDPRNGRLCTIEEWRKEPDPTIAELVCITGGIAGPIAIYKFIIRDGNFGPKRFTWYEAQEAARKFRIYTKTPNIDIAPFQLPTRHDCIDIYDARFCGLDEALTLIGGDSLAPERFWLGEEDPDPEAFSRTAYIFYGFDGKMELYPKDFKHRVRPVVGIDLDMPF